MVEANVDEKGHRSMSQPLEGLRVLEYGTGSGSAYCASLLCEMGARVDKVAGPAAGEDSPSAILRRRAESAYLDSGKNTVHFGFGDPEFLAAVRDSRVVIRGADPDYGVAKEIRDEYDACRSVNPDVIFIALTPFGVEGPASKWIGGDLNAQAVSGWTWIVGNPDEPPLSASYSMGALQMGLAGAGAALAALLERGGDGGGGEFVDVSEADVIAACIRVYSLVYRFFDIELTRDGYRASGSSGRYPHTMLPCKDGYISTIGRSLVDWQRFMEMMGNPEWSQNPRYQDFFKMATEYPEEVDALIVPWLMQHTKQELAELAIKYRVPLAPVCTVEEALENPQFRDRGFFRVVEVGDQFIRVPGSVAQWTRPD